VLWHAAASPTGLVAVTGILFKPLQGEGVTAQWGSVLTFVLDPARHRVVWQQLTDPGPFGARPQAVAWAGSKVVVTTEVNQDPGQYLGTGVGLAFAQALHARPGAVAYDAASGRVLWNFVEGAPQASNGTARGLVATDRALYLVGTAGVGPSATYGVSTGAQSHYQNVGSRGAYIRQLGLDGSPGWISLHNRSGRTGYDYEDLTDAAVMEGRLYAAGYVEYPSHAVTNNTYWYNGVLLRFDKP
jgi:hypothetical protein